MLDGLATVSMCLSSRSTAGCSADGILCCESETSSLCGIVSALCPTHPQNGVSQQKPPDSTRALLGGSGGGLRRDNVVGRYSGARPILLDHGVCCSIIG